MAHLGGKKGSGKSGALSYRGVTHARAKEDFSKRKKGEKSTNRALSKEKRSSWKVKLKGEKEGYLLQGVERELDCRGRGKVTVSAKRGPGVKNFSKVDGEKNWKCTKPLGGGGLREEEGNDGWEETRHTGKKD